MKNRPLFRHYSATIFTLLFMTLFQFGRGQTTVTSAAYSFDTNLLSVNFSTQINTSSLDLSKLHLSDGETTVPLTNAVNLTAPENQSYVNLEMLYGSMLDSSFGQYYGDNHYQFRFWGTNTSLLEAVESLNTGTLVLQVDEDAFEDLSGNSNTADELSCTVTPSTSTPQLVSATYAAQENELTLIFDQLV
ncbi:MAG: hypothetical protein CO167_10775, partial [Candidatus Marinimicrobia bacterium CG_4_9_14_3_um_filter_48_9]